MFHGIHQFQSPAEPPDDGGGTPTPADGFPAMGDDLPYKVELWDETGKYVEQVVAVSVTPAIGYAAYYAAAREYPGRAVTLRHKASVISRWTGRSH